MNTTDKQATMVNVRWYCSYYVGQARWHGTERYEPDTCDTEFDTVEAREEFDLKLCRATCPRCKSELNMHDDEPEIITGDAKPMTAKTLDLSAVCFIVDTDEIYVILDNHRAMTIRFYPDYKFEFSASVFVDYPQAINEILSLSHSLDTIAGEVGIRRGALIDGLTSAGMYQTKGYNPLTYKGLASG